MAPIPFILGQPIAIWMGAVTLLMLIITASVGFSIHKGWLSVPIKYHLYLACTTIAFAIIHASVVFYWLFL